MEIKDKRIKDFLNEELKDYAKYVIRSRTMPSIMDGLRVGVRKILWAAITGDLAKRKMVKLPSLIGDSMKLHYQHGDASLMGSIVQLCRPDVIKYHPLEIIGQIGNLRIPKCETAPRYLHVKQSNYIELFTKDIELLEQQISEGDKIEPKFLLPIIPIQLLYRTNNPGFGFSYRAFSYTLDSIIDCCIHTILNGDLVNSEYQLIPHVEGIANDNWIYNSNKNSWYNIGEYIIDEKNDTLTILDLPYDVSFEKYVEHLDNLKEKYIIKDYTDLGIDGKIKYHIVFHSGNLNKKYNENKFAFFNQFKLLRKLPNDIISCVDEDGDKLLFFETPYHFIETFITKRLKYYNIRKIRRVKQLETEIKDLQAKSKFIDLVINDKLIINKRKRSDIIIDLQKHDLPELVLSLKIDKLTSDEITKLNNKINELIKLLEYIKITPIEIMYINELIELKYNFGQIEKQI